MKNTKRSPSLEAFLPKESKAAKSFYTMVKFNNRPDLLEFMVNRVKRLGTSKNAYVLALIELDMEVTRDKKD